MRLDGGGGASWRAGRRPKRKWPHHRGGFLRGAEVALRHERQVQAVAQGEHSFVLEVHGGLSAAACRWLSRCAGCTCVQAGIRTLATSLSQRLATPPSVSKALVAVDQGTELHVGDECHITRPAVPKRRAEGVQGISTWAKLDPVDLQLFAAVSKRATGSAAPAAGSCA